MALKVAKSNIRRRKSTRNKEAEDMKKKWPSNAPMVQQGGILTFR